MATAGDDCCLNVYEVLAGERTDELGGIRRALNARAPAALFCITVAPPPQEAAAGAAAGATAALPHQLLPAAVAAGADDGCVYLWSLAAGCAPGGGAAAGLAPFRRFAVRRLHPSRARPPASNELSHPAQKEQISRLFVAHRPPVPLSVFFLVFRRGTPGSCAPATGWAARRYSPPQRTAQSACGAAAKGPSST